MTESEKELLIRLWDSGKTNKEIFQLFPYKQQYLRQQIKKLKEDGVLKGKNAKTQEKTREKILQAYHSGMTNPYEIAEYVGICMLYVNNVLCEEKLNRKRPPQNYKKKELSESTKKIIDEIKNGTPIANISKKYSVSTQYVYFCRKKYVKE